MNKRDNIITVGRRNTTIGRVLIRRRAIERPVVLHHTVVVRTARLA